MSLEINLDAEELLMCWRRQEHALVPKVMVNSAS